MKIYPIYDNRFLYIEKMQEFADGKHTGKDFSEWFLSQRHQDLDETLILTEEELKRYRKIHLDFSKGVINSDRYFQLLREILWHPPWGNLYIKLFDELQSRDIEDFHDYYFTEKFGGEFEEWRDKVDEEELRKRVKAKLQLLKDNEGNW